MSPPRPLNVRVDRTVADAVRHIRERIRVHNTETSVKIGEYLFRELYRGRRSFFHRGGDDLARRCITRIARDPRVDVDDDVLLMCVHCYLLVQAHGRQAPGLRLPSISAWKWERLYRLEDDPEALVTVAAWVARENVPHSLLATAASLVEPYRRAGGSIEDLLVATLGPGTVVRRIERMLGVAEKALARDGLPASVRARTLETLDALIASL